MSIVPYISRKFNSRKTLPRSIRIMRTVAVAGIALGVAALVVATSIGRGFERGYKKALLDFNAHVVVMGGGEISEVGEVAAAIAKLSPLPPDKKGLLHGPGMIAPFVGLARAGWRLFSSAHGTVSLLFMDFPSLQKIWLALYPDEPGAILPGWIGRLIRESDDADSRGVVAWTPFLYREALSIGGGRISGVVVKGIDPETMRSVNAMPIRYFGEQKSLSEALSDRGDGLHRVIVGRALANKLGIVDRPRAVKLLVPREGEGADGSRRFDEVTVEGFFESGMHDYDAQFMLMSLHETRALFGVPDSTVTGVELKLDDPEKAGAVANRIEKLLGPGYGAVTWSDLNRELLTAVRLEQLVSSLIMGIMVIVAALNIVAVLVLMTIYRLHEISVLKALGLGRRDVAALLTRGGAAVGLYGAVAGLLLGSGTAFILGRPGVIPLEAEVYLVGALPIDISPLICGMIALFCLGVGFLTSRFAAAKLSDVPIAEGLKIAR